MGLTNQQQYAEYLLGPMPANGGDSTAPSLPSSGSNTATAPIAGAGAGGSQSAPASGGVLFSFLVKLAAPNTPQPCIGYRVPPGAGVTLRANNGTTVGNSAVIFAANYPSAFVAGQGVPLAPLDTIAYPCDNLANLWFYGALNDGVVVTVTKSL